MMVQPLAKQQANDDNRQKDCNQPQRFTGKFPRNQIGSRQDGAAEARHGLSGIRNQYYQRQPDQIVVHFNSNRDRLFTNA